MDSVMQDTVVTGSGDSRGAGLAQVRKFFHLAKENLHYVQPAITGLLHREGGLSWQPFVLGLRENGTDLAIEDVLELKERPREVVVFVHGLMGDDIQWKQTGTNQVDLGNEWAHRYDVLPLYVRYNTGDHISVNGRRLANLLEHLSVFHSPNVTNIRIVAHSLGGLVVQSAVHYAATVLKHKWTSHVSSILFLGTPHDGAGLERITRFSAQILDTVTVSTRAISRVINLRSDGIRDVGYGYIADEDWQKNRSLADRTDPPSLPGVIYTYVAGTMAENPDSREGRWLGDGIVSRENAHLERFRDSQPRGVRKITLSGVSHNGLMLDPRVLGLLK